MPHRKEIVSTELPLVESYKDYEPSFDVAALVREMIASLEFEERRGLTSVVLTNRAALSRLRRRQLEAHPQFRLAPNQLIHGLYHPKEPGSQPWVELFVDDISKAYKDKRFMRNLQRRYAFGSVFFHQVSQHLYATAVNMSRADRDEAMKKWREHMLSRYLRRRLPIIGWLTAPIDFVVRIIRRIIGLFKKKK